MREIVMDTETTGLDPAEGHRIVEIGGVELINHLPTGRTYHQYINPERSMPREAFDVHGLGDDFLRSHPVFAQVADAFLAFVGDAKLVIHNASFDMMFLNAELGWLGKPALPMAQSIDTLAIARRKFPGAQASLDALCKRFGVDNSAREKHGALLDSEILAEVYLELLGGRQQGLTLSTTTRDTASTTAQGWVPPARPRPLPGRITDEERAAHAEFIAEFGDKALWGTGASGD
ncbi:MAG: DNA polymerase III subunit epsilon [Pseudomonadota bacterium]